MKIKPLTLEQQAASDRVHLLGGLQARLLNEEGHDSPAYQQVERDLDAAIDERSRSMGWATFAPSPPPPAPALATMPPSSSLKRFPPDLNRGDSQRNTDNRVFVH